MQEKTLFKVAFSTSLIGLSIMVLMAEKLDFSESNISSISKSSIGQKIKVMGIVQSKNEFSNILILNIADSTGPIKVIAYKNRKYQNINKGDVLEITGLVKEYNNELELEAISIRKL